jgi:hypothetical protein
MWMKGYLFEFFYCLEPISTIFIDEIFVFMLGSVYELLVGQSICGFNNWGLPENLENF